MVLSEVSFAFSVELIGAEGGEERCLAWKLGGRLRGIGGR